MEGATKFPPTVSTAGQEVCSFVASLREQFYYQFNVSVPYNKFAVLPGECFGKILIITPLEADRLSSMGLPTPGYLPEGIDPEEAIMLVTEPNQVTFRLLLTYGFQKPNRDTESQYEAAEMFAQQKSFDLDHGIAEMRMRMEEGYPFVRTFALQDRVEHLIEEHKDDKDQFLVNIMSTLVVRIMIRKTPDGRHTTFQNQTLRRIDISSDR